MKPYIPEVHGEALTLDDLEDLLDMIDDDEDIPVEVLRKFRDDAEIRHGDDRK